VLDPTPVSAVAAAVAVALYCTAAVVAVGVFAGVVTAAVVAEDLSAAVVVPAVAGGVARNLTLHAPPAAVGKKYLHGHVCHGKSPRTCTCLKRTSGRVALTSLGRSGESQGGVGSGCGGNPGAGWGESLGSGSGWGTSRIRVD
jgi:hypothetical protein